MEFLELFLLTISIPANEKNTHRTLTSSQEERFRTTTFPDSAPYATAAVGRADHVEDWYGISERVRRRRAATGYV